MTQPGETVKLGTHDLPYHRETVKYIVISEQPYGGWEYSTSYMDDQQKGQERLARVRTNHPDQRHRLGIQVTTVEFDVLPEEL